jgi:hypothetical protein
MPRGTVGDGPAAPVPDGGLALHLVEILLPLFDNEGARLPGGLYTQVIEILAETFGGVTAFSRSPAEGLWRSGSEGDTRRDDVVVFEVMVEELDAEWWKGYRRSLERSFHQDEIVIRASAIVRL